MKWSVVYLVLFLAIIEERNKVNAVSKDGVAKTASTKVPKVKVEKAVPSTAPVKKTKSEPKQQETKKTAKNATSTKVKVNKSGNRNTIHVINIKVDLPPSNDNSTTSHNNSTNSSTSTVIQPQKDYTIVGDYKIFKYEDDHIKKDDCPPYWHKYDKNCYLFSRDRLNWYKASMKCFELGGFLTTVESSIENTYIINQLKAYKINRGAWMGLNTVLHPKKHTWHWGFSGSQNHGFDWYGFEPAYKKKGDFLCAIFWKTYHFHWHVESCSQENYYICKIKLKESCSCTF